ncbi:glycosyltransferase family 2 protein [Paenibacillus sp. N1-5-1-14]|uniref:glycosyltransferase family 2 protein n=1 Tax=Paenibacillus radicibacter TaxID=2972488 RepID=UPI002158B66C|nr:glycosyltransferase family 2 protein [Paenibacillus radicibacter]MCR8643146.1 glycosyltransferase family 2 protein [Paenibacillus radicibacter]
MSTLIIIPAYNEEGSIHSVIHAIKRTHPEVDIVVINDGSRDRTVQIAEATGLAHVITMPVNVGIGGAMQTGYLYALRHGYDIAVQMDADGQHDPEYLAPLLRGIESGEADCMIGSRFVEKTEYRSSLSRRIGILFFSWLISISTKKRFTDPTSGFRAANRQVIEVFSNYYPDDYPEVEAIVLLERLGFNVKEASVLMHSRETGMSSITPIKSVYYMLKVSLSVLMTLLRTRRRAKA